MEDKFLAQTALVYACLELREADGEFFEDTDPIGFSCLPRVGEQIPYGRRTYTVIRVQHIESRVAQQPLAVLLCRPATREELNPFDV